jgi:NADH-quinone oxidoreductase subunit G
MAKITIKADGREIQAEAGSPLLQVLLDNGIFVPHYCYHPALSVAGNCRMCLVRIAGRPKLETSCTVRVTAPMEVETASPDVVKARQDVLEFLLINHPLDCPVCDQAGECLLQDYSYTYGRDKSRFREPKVIRGSRPLGPLVHYWGNRCIVCTRCVRFCDEIAGTGELAVTGRGDHSEIDVFDGLPLDNPLSGNVVDICPVGALLNRDFLYSARVWFLKTTSSVCAGCGRGCNILVDALGQEIKRLRPRLNRAVNDWWICDAGRMSHRSVTRPDRLRAHRIRGVDGAPSTVRAASAARDRLEDAVRRHGKDAVAGVASAFVTNEELYLFRRLLDRFGIAIRGCLARRAGEDRRFPGGFVIEAEKAPNRNGAETLLGPVLDGGMDRLADAVRDQSVRALVILGGDLEGGLSPQLQEMGERAEVPLLIDTRESPLASRAEVLLAGAAWAEKDGTFVNSGGRIQRLARAVEPPGDARPERELLQEMLLAAGERKQVVSAESVFQEMVAQIPGWGGLTWRGVGPLGIQPGGGA